jgi:hypothetical protein
MRKEWRSTRRIACAVPGKFSGLLPSELMRCVACTLPIAWTLLQFLVCLCIQPFCHTSVDHTCSADPVHLAGPAGTAGPAGCVCVRPIVCAPRDQVFIAIILIYGCLARCATRAYGRLRPPPFPDGGGDTSRLWHRSFPCGPGWARGMVAEPELYPLFGGLAVPLGVSPPRLLVQKGEQCGLSCSVSWVSEIRPAGLGLTFAVPLRVRDRVASDLCLNLDVLARVRGSGVLAVGSWAGVVFGPVTRRFGPD